MTSRSPMSLFAGQPFIALAGFPISTQHLPQPKEPYHRMDG